MPGPLAVSARPAPSQAQILFGWQLWVWQPLLASKPTFPLAPQSDQRRAHLRVCYGLPHGPLPSPRVRAPLPAHDKEVHGDRHQAIRHVFICGERGVRIPSDLACVYLRRTRGKDTK